MTKQILTFVGTGSAFTMDNFQSNAILEVSGKFGPTKNLLIDCGSDIRFSLKKSGKTYADIRGVYISHLHADHIGGLEWLALCTYFDPNVIDKPYLFLSEKLVQPLWDSLKGGLGTLQNKVANLGTFFDVNPTEKNKKFFFNGQQFKIIQVIHYYDGNEFACSYGMIWTAPDGQKVFFTSDTQNAPNQLKDFYEDVDIIFQDCETSPFPSGVHAHYDELKKLDESIKAKMWLYHYQDGELPDAVADGFRGFIQIGQSFVWTKD